VSFTVGYRVFTPYTRSHSDAPTSDPDAIVRRAVALLEKTDASRRPVRLLGAGVHNFEQPGEHADAGADEDARLPFEE
jgi:hypothetical protein